MPVRPEYADYYGKRVRLSEEGQRLVASSRQYRMHGPPPQEWEGTIAYIGKNACLTIQWAHQAKPYQWHRKYVEIFDDSAEAFVPRVRLGCEKAAPAPKKRVRAE